MKKEFITLKLSDMKPYENNPRLNDEAVSAVKESVKQCGYVAPIIIDEDNIILAGHLWASDRRQTTVLNFDRPTVNKEHPTMKPIALFDYQIKNNTKGGDAVLDLFGGSGTTVMACEQNGRTAYVMEYDPKYVDVIIKRWEKFTGKKAVLLNDD